MAITSVSTARLIATGISELLPMERGGDPLRHVSAIIRYLCIKLGHFEAEEADLDAASLASRQTRWELGSAFEQAVIDGLITRYIANQPHRFCRSGPLELDGLIGNPDLVDLEARRVGGLPDVGIIEVKLTWLSSKHDTESEKFWKYWVQLMAYCRMAECSLGYLHVCHINGNYRDSRDPVYNVWEREFTKRELDDNWRMLVNTSKQMRVLRERGELP